MYADTRKESQASREAIHVFVIESLPVVRIGLVAVLREQEEFQVLGDAPNVAEALPVMEEAPPDIVTIDPFLPGGGGVDTIVRLQQRFSGIKVIVLTYSDKRSDFVRAMRAGARAYLLKSLEARELVDSIRLVAGGRTLVYASRAGRPFDGPANPGNEHEAGSNGDCLTDREKEILWMAAQGASNKEIAAQCYVSHTTVKAHLRRISEKLEVKNRTEAVAMALSRGYLSTP